MGDRGGKTLPDLYYANDLSILDESVCKMNEFFRGFAEFSVLGKV